MQQVIHLEALITVVCFPANVCILWGKTTMEIPVSYTHLRIEHDLYYIENWTLGLDIKILFLTVFKGFINKNAY